MKIKFTLRLLLLLCLILHANALYAQKRHARYIEYIDQYQDIAVKQMQKYRIPASITLAQGLLESGAGQSTLAMKSNNHFGIKCGGNWRGKSVKHDDDARNECFRAYRNSAESYEDHSVFLTSNARYSFLFKLDITDYKAWARGLKKAGYATDPSYANRLIQIIEDYELYRYDSKRRNKKQGKEDSSISATPHQVYIANELLYVIARRGDTFESIAKEFATKAKRLIKYNDLFKDYTLSQGDIIYLHEKKKKALKQYQVYVVGDGDSMHGIAQRYGIKLKSLYKMNNKSPEDYVPEIGDRLRLR